MKWMWAYINQYYSEFDKSIRQSLTPCGRSFNTRRARLVSSGASRIQKQEETRTLEDHKGAAPKLQNPSEAGARGAVGFKNAEGRVRRPAPFRQRVRLVRRAIQETDRK